MSGDSAQDIEVSITAPNRSFHATVIASDIAWQDRPTSDQQQQQPRRPIWSSAFGTSTDVESESYDPMVNSATSLSQDSYDGFAVEFISSKESEQASFMNGDVGTGASPSGAATGASPGAPEAAAAAFTASTTASDAVSSSVELRPTGYAETNRGSISCEMMTAKPVLVVGNGHLPTGGESTVTSSSTSATVTGTGDGTVTTTSSSSFQQSTVTTGDSTVTSTTVTNTAADGTVTGGTTVTTSSAATVTGEPAVTTHAPMAPGSTFQMELVEAHDEHAEAPETPRDRAMSLHERSLLAHDLHALAATMDTIRDEDEEVPIGSSTTTEEKKPEEEAYTPDRRQSLTGLPVSATTFIAHTQPTIFEAAEAAEEQQDAAAAAAPTAAAEAPPPAAAGEAAASSMSFASQYSTSMTSSSAVSSSSAATTDAAAAAPAAATTQPEEAPPAEEERVSPYLRKLLDAQEQTRQLMALLGESTQMLGTLPSTKAEAEKAEAAVTEIASNLSIISQSSSSMTASSSAFGSSSTTAAEGAAAPATAEAAAPAAPAADAVPASPAAAAEVPASPALEISSRPVDITFDDGSVVQPAAAPAADAAAAAAAPAAAPETQNASICTALESIAANMTTVTTTSSESSTSTVTTTAPVSLGTPVLQLQPAASPTTSLSEDAEPTGAVTPTPDAARLLHESTVQGLTVDQPTPTRLTPEPGQERFVTNSEETEATMTKSSFTLESSTTTSSSTEMTTASGAAAATTDYVPPSTTIVVTADDAAAAPSVEPAAPAAPAAAAEPTVTPAAVDVPCEIVRHLDDAAAWHSAPVASATEADGASAVPIAIVAAPSGPPPLARETRAPEAEAPPQGPPPLAREQEERQEFSRSVMVERRLLTSDGGAAAASTTAASITSSMEAQKDSTSTTSSLSSVVQNTPSSDVESIPEAATKPEEATEIPVTVWKPETTAEAPQPATTAPSSDDVKAQQPAETTAETTQPATTDIPVTVWQPETETAAAAQSVPVSAEEKDKIDISAEQKQEPEKSIDIPVTVSEKTTDAAPSVVAATPEMASTEAQKDAKDESSTDIPVTVWKPETTEATHVDSPKEPSKEAQLPAAAPASTADEAPLTVVLQPAQSQQPETREEPPVDIPVTVVQSAAEATPATEKREEATEAAPTDIPVTVVQSTDQAVAPPPTDESALKKETDTDIPVTVVQSTTTEQAAPPTTLEESAMKKDTDTDIPVTVVQSTTTEQAAAPPTALEEPTMKKETDTDIPVTIVKQPTTEAAEEPGFLGAENGISVPVTLEQEKKIDEQKQEPETATEIPVTVSEKTTEDAAVPQQPAAAEEVPVASAAQQEQQQAAPAADADAAAEKTSPTTSVAPISLEGTFQITPSDEDVAQAPTVLRDRAMSIHEKSLLAHDSSGFQSGLEPVAEHDEVHVSSSEAIEAARRRASVAPGVDGVPTAGFQLPSTSCLFTIEEGGAAAPGDDSEATTAAPASTTSPSDESASTTMVSSATDVIDVTAPDAAAPAAPQPPAASNGVKWLTDSEPAHEHSITPDSPQSVIAAVPAAAAAAPELATTISESAQPTKDIEGPAQTPKSDAAPTAIPETLQPDQPPENPKSPSEEASWVTVPATITTSELGTPLQGGQPPQTPTGPSEAAAKAVQESQLPSQTPTTEAASTDIPVAGVQPTTTQQAAVPVLTDESTTKKDATDTDIPVTVVESITAEQVAASVPSTTASETAQVAAAESQVAPPQTPKSPAEESCVSVPATVTTSEPVPSTNDGQMPPQTPKTPTGDGWVTEPAPTTLPEPTKPVPDSQPVQTLPITTAEPAPAVESQAAPPPQTPKTPTGVSWITEQPATTTTTEPVKPATDSQAPPETPKSPSEASWVTVPATITTSEPAPSTTTTDSQAPPQTPKTPTGVAWITEPAAAVPAAAAAEAPPRTPKSPPGVAWITEPAAPAQATSGAPDVAVAAAAATATKPPAVINITADGPVVSDKGGAASPRTPTSPGIRWASESTRTGGNADISGAPPAPSESTFVVNAPWEGKDAPAAPSAPDADGVTWITETPKEAEEAKQRPPLTRSESTRSEREASSATDVTVRAATPQRKTLAPGISGEEETPLDLTNGVTQESLGTKVRKLSWADQQQSGAEDSFSAAIDDYEKKLNETTAQTRELVDLLCQTGSQITENSMKMSDVFSDAVQASVRSMLDQERKDRAATGLPPIAENGESFPREPPPQLIAGALPPNVESVIVSCEQLKFVTGSLVLESANILVTDEEAGMFLFTLDSKVVRHVTNPAWKHASSPVIFKDRLKSYILVLMDCKDEDDGAWVRHIVKFTENLDYIEKVECPKWIRERTIISDRLAVNRYENIYYCANGEIFSGLYELAPTGKWTELLYRQSESFVDMLAFAIIGPIQQILIVEGRRDHVLLCSIRESQCVEARRMALCERPGALARDESGRLFVMNRAQAAIQIVDTRVWAACRNMALVDKFVPHFSAAYGMLAVPQKRAVKVHKYAFEWDD